MDNHPSPPSSRKSSVLGKLDRPETPNRGSPYLTRSRRSSTLTEENVAVHNDTPTTRNSNRRVTRRMSQSSETANVSTPMPLKRTRRSPSVASGDDINATPKKKFSVAQENVVIEEDETVEENKLDSTIAGTNGSKIENEVDKENINSIVNGSVPEDKLPRKSLEFNKTGSPLVEQPAEPKVAAEAITVDSNKQNALPVQASAATTESSKPIVSTTQSSEPPSKSSPNPIQITNLQTVVAVNEHAQPDSTNLSATPSLDSPRKSTTEKNTTEDVNVEMTPKLDTTSTSTTSEINSTVLEMSTPTKSSSVSGSGVIVIVDTPNSTIVDDIIVIPETPLQTRQSSLEMKVSTGTPKIETPKVVTRQAIRQMNTPKTPVETKKSSALDVTGTTTPLTIRKIPKAATDTQQAEGIVSPETPLQTKNSVVPNVPSPVHPSPKTPIQTKNSVVPNVPAPVHPSPKTPIQTKKSGAPNVAASVAASSATKGTTSLSDDITPQSNLNYAPVTESEEEILLRTPPTSSTTAIELLKSKANATKTHSISKDDSVQKLSVSPSITTPLQNGIQGANDENPKWANTIRRKSDGQPIDEFGVNKEHSKETTLEAKPIEKENSTVIVRDSSDEESCIDADSTSEIEPRNMFLDDEAMESNGEASMDEDERKYLEENEIPEDGISLGSESDEAVSEEEGSDDSFIVSDSSVQLLDGSGDDLGIDDEPAELNKSKSKSRRGNKILDTSDDESDPKEEPKKSKKRRPESSLDSTAKYLRVDAEDEDDNANEGGDEDELANLDAEPKKTRSSKRLSESTSLSKTDTKRLSLHPNMKLSVESKKEQRQQTTLKKNNRSRIDDDSEEDVTEELANLDDEPKKMIRSKTLSESLESPKKNVVKRMSLHPNTKLSNVENGPTTADVEEELANLDVVPKKSKNNKRLSDLIPLSKKETKRLSLHPNTKLTSLGSSENVQQQNQQQTTVKENDSTREDENNIEEELANLDDDPKQMGKSKRLSAATSILKKDKKRLSLHPDTKLNRSGFDDKVDEPTVPTADDSNDVEKMDVDQSVAPSVNPPKKEIESSVEEIQAKCNEVLQMANEAKRLEKLNKKPMQEDKYQKLKEKKTAKLQEKKAKEARALEREEQAAKQRQLKRDKKSKIAEVTEEEKSKAIEKALKFSEKILVKKAKHSNEATEKPLNESTEEESTTSKRKRKPKKLQILNEGSNPTKKKRVDNTVQLPAKPEGFKINSLPVKNNKIRKDIPKRIIQQTSAGGFEIEPLPKKSASPFVVTTLQYNPAIKFSSFKDKAIANSNVQRVSASQLLSRKSRAKKMSRN